LVAVPSFSLAQYYYGWGYRDNYSASTAQEGMARGMAHVVRAAGEATLMRSEALKNIEDARARNLENRLRAAEVYHQRKRVWEARQAAKRKKRRPPATYAFRHNRSSGPQPLSRSQLDPVTGRIQWPVLLQRSEFQTERQALERMFKVWAAQDGVLRPEQLSQVQELGKKLKERIHLMIRAVSSQQYVDASRFLKGLMFEAVRGAG
jgi:hypothetical protein